MSSIKSQQDSLTTGKDLGAQQAQKLKDSQKKTPEPKIPNRYDQTKKEIADGILFGAFTPEVLAAKEGEQRGLRANQYDKIKLYIRDEYFDRYQYLGGFILGVSLGLLVATVVIINGFGFGDWSWGPDVFAKLAVFFIVFAIMSHYGKVRTKRKLICDPENKNVPKGRKGMECFQDYDCSLEKGSYFKNTCKPERPGYSFVRFLRSYGELFSLLIGIGMIPLAISNGQSFPSGPDLGIPIMLGMGSGIFYGYIFS